MCIYIVYTEFNYNKTNVSEHKLDLQVVKNEAEFESLVTSKLHSHTDEIVQRLDARIKEHQFLKEYLAEATCDNEMKSKLREHLAELHHQINTLKSGKYDPIRTTLPLGDVNSILNIPLKLSLRKQLLTAVAINYPSLNTYKYHDTELCLLFKLPKPEEPLKETPLNNYWKERGVEVDE